MGGPDLRGQWCQLDVPTVDLLTETRVYCFAEQRGTLGSVLTSATEGWRVPIIRMLWLWGPMVVGTLGLRFLTGCLILPLPRCTVSHTVTS